MKFIKILLFVFGLLLTVGSLKVYAQLQEMVITEVTAAPEDAVVMLDHPGKVILSFRSGIPNMNFSSSFQILDERTPVPGEYLVIVEPENQIITVSAPGYLAERIPLRALQPSQRFYYIVEPKAQAMDETIPMVLQTQPAGATVEINGETVDITRSVPLAPGTHLVKVSSDGYRTIEREIEADRENTFNEFVLEPLQEVPVTIRTQPAGATISIDGTTVGQSDASGLFQQFQFPDTYSVTVSMVGYLNEQREIDVTDTENEFEFTLIRSASLLALQVSPVDANVTINRQAYDVSQPVELSPGLYRIEAERRGYRTVVETVRLGRNETVERIIELQPITGSLRFISSPASALVILSRDGEIYNEWTGINQLDLPTGTYRLEAIAEGYKNYSETITIQEGQTLHKQITLLSAENDEVAEGLADVDEEVPVLEHQSTEIDTAPTRWNSMTFSVAAISSFLNNQTFRSNYNNGYGIQAAVRILPVSNLFAEVNAGYAYHGFTSSNPLGEIGLDYGSLNKVFGGITVGYQQSVSLSTDLYAGAGYQISSYQLDTVFFDEEAQGYNTLYAEAGGNWGMLGVIVRYGITSNKGSQSLLEYGIRIHF